MENEIELENYFEKKTKKTKKGSLIVLGGLGVFLSPALAMVSDLAGETYFTQSVVTTDNDMSLGTIGYEKLKECLFVQIKDNNLGIDEFYICAKTMPNMKQNTYKYINIFDKKTIFECSSSIEYLKTNNNKRIVNEISISDYLYEYNDIKQEYTSEEVENLLEQIKEDIKEEEKVLVKAKFNANDVTKVNL